MQHNAKSRVYASTSHGLWLGPLLYMMVVGLYFVARFDGRWAEGDSAGFATMIRVFAQEGRLVPAHGDVYPNGYAFQAISTFILALTSLDVGTLQQIVYPLIACLLVLPAWALYRELTGSARGAAIATMLLFTQPEFLFVILRSSHEKFTRALLLIGLYLLVRSFKLRDRPWLFATHVGLFYVVVYALIASNNLLAHSFIAAITAALLLGWVLEWRNPHWRESRPVLRRLPFVLLTCLGLVYVFTFYAYPPAQHDVQVLQGMWNRSAALVLDVEHKSTNAYAAVTSGWINLQVYFIVSIANWIILLASFLIWARQGLRWLWKGATPQPQVAWFLWLLYAAFAVQGALSVVVDASGALGANLQHRLFPSFSIIGVALVGAALAKWRPRHLATPIRAALTASIACIAILSILKATNEPALSNKWTFYRASEMDALEWSDANLRDRDIWTEFDERLHVAFNTTHGESRNRNHWTVDLLQPTTHDIVMTDVTRLRASRMGYLLPVLPDAFRVYDNGEAQVYHLRPQTPYQR